MSFKFSDTLSWEYHDPEKVASDWLEVYEILTKKKYKSLTSEEKIKKIKPLIVKHKIRIKTEPLC
jgi:hypothetical protein